MDWTRLLSTKRLGRAHVNEDNAPPPRTHFTRDYDRIIFSSAFRRLQDKTQVFPLAKSDYVRTRLTHSLEVASVGRSLGMLAADAIHRKDVALRELVVPHDIGTIVSTACLAHDIGNPPFGHAGESAIQEWFQSVTVLGDNGIGRSEQQDLLQFEGNAQGFRTLCSLQNQPRPGGLQLTLAVLGTFSKYPRESHVDKTQAAGISGKKFGVMQAEAPLFQELADELGLVAKPGAAMAWHRHPLAFLVEAADDICYHVMDVEDGFKAGAIAYDVLEALHKPWLSPTQVKQALTITDEQRRAEYFRAVTVNQMIGEMINVFESNYDGLMTGAFDAELSEQIPRKREFDNFKSIAKANVYNARPVVEVEACGFEVIAGLLNAFVDAIETIAKNKPTGKVRARTVISLMPGGMAAVAGRPAYERIILATDFVSGMTDSYAVELYQRIRGIALP